MWTLTGKSRSKNIRETTLSLFTLLATKSDKQRRATPKQLLRRNRGRREQALHLTLPHLPSTTPRRDWSRLDQTQDVFPCLDRSSESAGTRVGMIEVAPTDGHAGQASRDLRQVDAEAAHMVPCERDCLEV